MTQPSTVVTGQGDPVDEMISAAVRGLVAQRRVTPAQVAAAVGVSRSAFFYKLGGDSPWKAQEVDRLARYFNVSRDSLYEGRADFRDAASTYGSEGWGFESLRVHPFRRNTDRRRRRSNHVVPLRLVA